MKELSQEETKKLFESTHWVNLTAWGRYAENHTEEETEQWYRENETTLKEYLDKNKRKKTS